MKKNYFDTKRKLSQSGASSNALNSTFFMMDKLLSTRPRAEVCFHEMYLPLPSLLQMHCVNIWVSLGRLSQEIWQKG